MSDVTRRGPRRRSRDLFLVAHALAECAARLAPGETALVVLPDRPGWREAAAPLGLATCTLADLEPASCDALIAVGILERSEEAALAAFVLGQALRPGGRLVGAALGRSSLGALRSALLDAERASGRAAQRLAPLLDAPALGDLLDAARLAEVVIDVERLTARYSGLGPLLADVRAMGCGWRREAVPPLARSALAAAERRFLAGAGRAEERFELLYFAARRPIAV